MAARLMRLLVLCFAASSALAAQASGNRLVVGVLGTPLNRVQVWIDNGTQVGLSLTRGEMTVGCGAQDSLMRAWADSLDRFTEQLRGLSAVDDLEPRVSAAVPGCGIVGVALRIGGVRSYAVRHIGEARDTTQVAVTAGTLRRIASEIRGAGDIVDSARAQVARSLNIAPDDPRLRQPTSVPGVDQVYFDFQVDRPVRAVAGAGSPRYPEELRAQEIEGEVLARFVIDSTGRVVLSSYAALRVSHPEFGEAVRRALPQMLFTPAIKDGRNVAQLVQQPFLFKLARD